MASLDVPIGIDGCQEQIHQTVKVHYFSLAKLDSASSRVRCHLHCCEARLWMGMALLPQPYLWKHRSIPRCTPPSFCWWASSSFLAYWSTVFGLSWRDPLPLVISWLFDNTSSRSKPKNNRVVLYGPMSSGKTCLFYRVWVLVDHPPWIDGRRQVPSYSDKYGEKRNQDVNVHEQWQHHKNHPSHRCPWTPLNEVVFVISRCLHPSLAMCFRWCLVVFVVSLWSMEQSLWSRSAVSTSMTSLSMSHSSTILLLLSFWSTNKIVKVARVTMILLLALKLNCMSFGVLWMMCNIEIRSRNHVVALRKSVKLNPSNWVLRDRYCSVSVSIIW